MNNERYSKDRGSFTLIAKTLPYLEEVLAEEITEIGGTVEQIVNRAVYFTGNQETMYKANLHLRTALRILKPVEYFSAKHTDHLYRQMMRINWQKYMKIDQTFAIDAVVNSNFFRHSKYVALKGKDAIADWHRNKTRRRPYVDTKNPDVRFHIHIDKHHCTIALDSSGSSLHKRSYREVTTAAPINEVLAAGMIKMAKWDVKKPFIDPMCGSGTILIEAAMMAKNIPANWQRSEFGFFTWKDFDEFLWQNIRSRAKRDIKKEGDFPLIKGSDIDRHVVRTATRHAWRANVSDVIAFETKDVRRTGKTDDMESGLIITNPPYGERLEEEEDLESFYKEIGDCLKQNYEGFDAWILSGNSAAMKRIGLRASKRKALYNGALPCKYYKYELYQGTKRS